MSDPANLPNNLKFTASHEWIRTEADGSISIGITEHAQQLLGDIVFVEAPAVGRKLQGEGRMHRGRIGEGRRRRVCAGQRDGDGRQQPAGRQPRSDQRRPL